MKNKAPLSLMEQLIMLLVFALAAALCLQIFVFSDQVSRHCRDRGQAATALQNTAEAVKSCRGDISQYPHLLGGSGDDNGWTVAYDADWKPAGADQASYRIHIVPVPTDLSFLGNARISACTDSGEELFRISVAWQEVAP